MSRRVVVRPAVRVGLWTGLTVPHVVVGVGLGPVAGWLFALGALALLGAVWWPRLVVDDDGIEVRNVRTYRVAWSRLARVRYEDQLPYRSRFTRALVRRHSRFKGIHARVPGVVVHPTGGAAPVPALAAQTSLVAVLAGVRGEAEAVAAALRTPGRGADRLAAVRAARRPVAWLAKAAASAAFGVLVASWLLDPIVQ